MSRKILQYHQIITRLCGDYINLLVCDSHFYSRYRAKSSSFKIKRSIVDLTQFKPSTELQYLQGSDYNTLFCVSKAHSYTAILSFSETTSIRPPHLSPQDFQPTAASQAAPDDRSQIKHRRRIQVLSPHRMKSDKQHGSRLVHSQDLLPWLTYLFLPSIIQESFGPTQNVLKTDIINKAMQINWGKTFYLLNFWAVLQSSNIIVPDH